MNLVSIANTTVEWTVQSLLQFPKGLHQTLPSNYLGATIQQEYLVTTIGTLVLFLIYFYLLRPLYKLFFTPLIISELPTPIPKESLIRTHDLVKRGSPANNAPSIPNGWFKIIDSHQLKVGEAQYHRLCGEDLVVYRGEDGVVRVMDAYCTHLGANLGLNGKVSGNCIQCPFHEWEFDGEDGKCTKVPYICEGASIPTSAHSKAYPAMEVNDTIYFYFNSEGESFNWVPPEMSDHYEDPKMKNMVFHGKFEEVLETCIQDIPENGADTAHFVAVHSRIFQNETLHKILSYYWAGEWKPEEDEDRKHEAWVFVDHHTRFMGIPIPFSGASAKVHQIGPGIVLIHVKTALGSVTINQNVTPINPYFQKLSHSVHSSPGIFMRIFSKIAILRYADQVHNDAVIWTNKVHVSRPALVKGDGNIPAFRRWYSQFYPKTPTQKGAHSLDW